VKVLIAFLLVVMIASVWETRRGRRPRALPLVGFSLLIAVTLFTTSRFV
jgi:hypothetical protein